MARKLPVRKDTDDENPMESVRQYLSSEADGPWLLIVDNADDIDMLFRSSDTPGGVIEYLPESKGGLTLFTTRCREVVVEVVGNDVVEMHEMSLQEAESFLEKSLIWKDILHNTAATTHHTAAQRAHLSSLGDHAGGGLSEQKSSFGYRILKIIVGYRTR